MISRLNVYFSAPYFYPAKNWKTTRLGCFEYQQAFGQKFEEIKPTLKLPLMLRTRSQTR
jgi:hypothetical protein